MKRLILRNNECYEIDMDCKMKKEKEEQKRKQSKSMEKGYPSRRRT
ncbi:MAG: hypothetical protein PUB19_02460 [Lachnospiraceae bacterium]|nr:hypothetical protein [Lachnospiraceae bacterium]